MFGKYEWECSNTTTIVTSIRYRVWQSETNRKCGGDLSRHGWCRGICHRSICPRELRLTIERNDSRGSLWLQIQCLLQRPSKEALSSPGPHYQGSAFLPPFSMLDKGKQKQTQPYPDETPPLLGSPNSKTLGTYSARNSPVQLAQDEHRAGPSTATHLGRQHRGMQEREEEQASGDTAMDAGENIPGSESAGRDMKESPPNTDEQRSSRVDGSPRSHICLHCSPN